MTLRGNRRRAQSWPASIRNEDLAGLAADLEQSPVLRALAEGRATYSLHTHPFGAVPGVARPAKVAQTTEDAPCASGNVTGCPLTALRHQQANQSRQGAKEFP